MEGAQLFLVPPDTDGTGLFVGGAWLQYQEHPVHGRVLVAPAAGDYGMVRALGYQPVPTTPTPTPDAESAAGA